MGYCLTILAVGLAPQESLITSLALVPRSEQLGQRAGVPGRLWLLAPVVLPTWVYPRPLSEHAWSGLPPAVPLAAPAVPWQGWHGLLTY